MKKATIALLAAGLLALSASGQNLEKEIANNTAPPARAEAIAPSDGADLPHVTTAIWVGGTGTIKVDMKSGGTVTLTAVPAGYLLRIGAKKVYATGTTATNMIAFF